MTTEWVLIACGLALYFAASVLAALRMMCPADDGERAATVAAALGMAVFAVVLLMDAAQTGTVPAVGRFQSMTCYAVAVTAAFLAQARECRSHGLSAILLPYVTIVLAIAAPGAGQEPGVAVASCNTWLSLHVLATLSGYALFTLSCLYGVAYLVQDHNLKRKHFGATFERLPSLGILDRQMHRQMGTALLMLTLGIVFGARLVSLAGGGAEWLSDPKVAATLMTWVVYAALWYVRGRVGRHGRGIALATVVALVLVLFAFFGIHLLAESRHSFSWPLIPGDG
jgi:ABC-type transport system involved in cytochrome c biogenesis permease subunit